jgi:hypothetical protein
VTPLDAIVMLAFQSMNLQDTHEQATVVVCAEECRALPASRQNEGNFRLYVQLKPGERIAAIVHTHPSSNVMWDESEKFSPDDKQMADSMHVPSYVYFAKLNQVRVYEPKVGERVID